MPRTSSLQGLTWPTSAPFRVRVSPVSDRLSKAPMKVRLPLWRPAAFRPPAFASWAILFPPRTWAFLTVGLPDRSPDLDGVCHVPHARDPAGEGAAYAPGRRCSRDRLDASGRRPPLPSGQPYTPALRPTIRGSPWRGGHPRFTHVHPSGLPLTGSARMEGAPLGFPPSSAPRRYRRRTPRWGPAMNTRPGLRHRRHRRSFRQHAHPTHATSCRTT
jgi:hypothetical protein